MIIADELYAKKILESNTYYNFINAYKDIFIDKTASTEKYLAGTSFEHILALWNFDKYLRLEVLRCANIVERIFKSKVMHVFSRHFGTDISIYLNINNFHIHKQQQAKKLIDEIMTGYKKRIANGDPMLCHYRKKQCTPFWVLINTFSFRQVVALYEYSKSSIQSEISKELFSLTGKKVLPHEIINQAQIINLFRNNAAHDQRIYMLSPRNQLSANHVTSIHLKAINGTRGLFSFICSLYSFFESDVYSLFIGSLKRNWQKLADGLENNAYLLALIEQKTRFSSNWDSLEDIE